MIKITKLFYLLMKLQEFIKSNPGFFRRIWNTGRENNGEGIRERAQKP